jgi:hypothetical protein
MRVRRTLAPDQEGTKKLLRQYDSQRMCACYRDDAERRLRFPAVAADMAQAIPRSASPPGLLVWTLLGIEWARQKGGCNDSANTAEAGGILQAMPGDAR